MIHDGGIKIPFNYAAGMVGSRFLVALRDEGTILGARCDHCQIVIGPAKPFCARCGEQTGELTPIGPEGTLRLATTLPNDGSFGLIQLDGADTAMLHRLLGEPSDFQSNTRLRARFAEERSGNILDIEGFEPVSKME